MNSLKVMDFRRLSFMAVPTVLLSGMSLLSMNKKLFYSFTIIYFLLASSLLQAATTITQTFNQSEATLAENFTQSTGGNPASPFTWSSTGGIGNTGKVAIPLGSDQIWTTKQKYSVVDNGVYQIKALFRTSGTGYGSLGMEPMLTTRRPLESPEATASFTRYQMQMAILQQRR